MNFFDDSLLPENQEKLVIDADETLARLGYAPNRPAGVRGTPLAVAA
jgi:hypothetical protein